MDNNKITEQESLRIISAMISRARKEELGKWNFVSIYGIAGALLCLVAKVAGNGPWMWAWTAVPLLAWGLPWLFVRSRRRSATLFSSIAGKSFFWLMVMGELFAVSSMQRNPDIIINLMMVPLGCAMFMLTGLLRMRSLLTMGFWSVLLAVWRFFTLDERFFSGMGFHSSLFYLMFFAVCAATGYGIDSSCNDKENSLCSDR